MLPLVVFSIHLLLKNWITAGVLGLLYGVHPLERGRGPVDRRAQDAAVHLFRALVPDSLCPVRAPKAQTGRGDWKPYLACLLAYGCALLSKPTALPCGLLLVLDYWPLQRRPTGPTLREKVPFLVVAALAAVVAVISQTGTGPDQGCG